MPRTLSRDLGQRVCSLRYGFLDFIDFTESDAVIGAVRVPCWVGVVGSTDRYDLPWSGCPVSQTHCRTPEL
jgi:hypothetical protein